MRIVFMGTPEFAVPSLRALIETHEVVAVYTRPDAVSGRGSQLRPSPVKEVALSAGIEVVQPVTLRDPQAVEQLAAFAPDVIVVAAYGLILPPEVLAIPPHGCINVHGSLLPRWRGAAPIQRAILSGDRQTGVSIMRMEEGLDTGPFCAAAIVDVDDLTTPELMEMVAHAGATALIDALPAIAQGSCTWTPQDESGVTYADKIAKADVALDPALGPLDLVRRVRASSAQAPAKTVIAGKGVTVIAAHVADSPCPQGRVCTDAGSLMLGADEGAIALDTVKPDGKQAMDAGAWARGLRLNDSTEWGTPR